MAITDSEKVEIRKYCGYMAFGNTPVPNNAWRYSVEYGDLEFRILNLSVDEQLQVQTFYLPNLRLLEADIPKVRLNSDTDRAAVWYRNARELKERWELFTSMRRYLCEFIGAAYGPALQGTFMRVCIG